MPPQSNNPYTGNTHTGVTKSGFKYLLIIAALVILLILALGFGVMSFTQMKDYKNNSDQKSAIAVKRAMATQEKALKAQFAETEKEPLKAYITPAAFGSVKILYPKTWSAYVIENNSGGQPVEGYFYPDYVPNASNDKQTNFALRLQISNSTYQNELQQLQNGISTGKIKSTTFKPEAVPNASIGVRLDGQISPTKKGSMVILPLRDKVLKIWTENQANQGDFNNFVLKNLTYSP